MNFSGTRFNNPSARRIPGKMVSVKVEKFENTPFRATAVGNSQESVEIKVAKIDETLDRLSKEPILSSIEILERREDEKRQKTLSELDGLRAKLKSVEEKETATIEAIYSGLQEVDQLRKNLYPYAEEKSQGLLAGQIKELERKLGNLTAFSASQAEAIKSLDARLGAIEGKMNSLESVVGRIDFPIDQLKNFFSMLLDTNTQMKEFELEILTVMKRLRKIELELRAK